jgi:hypothetical protein
VLGAIFTFLLVYVAWAELGNISQTSSADFIHRFKKDFFTEETRTLIHLIDSGYIEFVDEHKDCERISFFKINEEKIKNSGLPDEIVTRLTKKKVYSTYEIDDLLLGDFEDVGFLENKGLVDIEMVYNEFSWYVSVVFENPEIQAYLKSQVEESPDIYENFKYIYTKCKSFEKVKAENKSVTIWKYKYKIYRSLGLEIE